MSSLRCPKCNHELDDATCVNNTNARPAHGDLSVCIYCGAANVFQENPPALRALTPEEIQGFNIEERELLSRAISMTAIMKAMGRETNH